MNDSANNHRMHRGASRFRASQLIGCNITNERDEALGSVQDIVLASDNRRIAYVVVAFGGFLGMGEKHFAMPWRLIGVSRDGTAPNPRINLAVDRETLKTAPGFDKDEWPDMADTAWSRKVDDYYGNRGNVPGGGNMMSNTGSGFGQDPDSDAFHFRRMSQLLGMEVVDANHESLAKVDDLIVDAQRAEVVGAALTFGGVIGMGKDIALVPVESVTLDRVKGSFTMSCTRRDLESMALPGGEWSDLDNDEWLTRGRRQCEIVRTARSNEISATVYDE